MRTKGGAALLLLSSRAVAFTPLALQPRTQRSSVLFVMKEPSTDEKVASSLLEQQQEGVRQSFFRPRPPETSPPEEWFRKDTEDKKSLLSVTEEEAESVVGSKESIEDDEETIDLSPLQMDGTTETFMSASSLAPPEFRAKMDDMVQEMWTREQEVQSLLKKVRGLTGTLREKTQAMSEFEDALEEEKELEGQLKTVRDQLKTVAKAGDVTEQEHRARVEGYQAVQDDLEVDVRALQDQMVQTQNNLRVEQARISTLTQRMLEVEGTKEFEEEEAAMEREALRAELEVQKAKVEGLLAQRDAGEEEQKLRMGELRAKVNNAKNASMQEQERLEQQRQEHKEERAAIQQDIQQQELAVQTAKTVVQRCEDGNNKAREGLQQQLKGVQKERKLVDQTVQQQTVELATKELQLRDRLIATTRSLEQLHYKLQNQKARQEWDQEFLTERLAAESKRLQLAQQQLAQEKSFNDRVRAEWQHELDTRDQRKKSTARIMRQRFDALRARLTGRARTTKKEGRDLERAMMEQYQGNVNELHDAMELLQEAVALSRESKKRLEAHLAVESDLVRQAEKGQQQSNASLELKLAEADMDILRLQKDEIRLTQTLEQRDADLENIESSARAILRAGWRLTKDRLGGLPRRIRRTK